MYVYTYVYIYINVCVSMYICMYASMYVWSNKISYFSLSIDHVMDIFSLKRPNIIFK